MERWKPYRASSTKMARYDTISARSWARSQVLIKEGTDIGYTSPFTLSIQDLSRPPWVELSPGCIFLSLRPEKSTGGRLHLFRFWADLRLVDSAVAGS